MRCIAVDDDMPALIDQIARGEPVIALDGERGALLFFAAEVASTGLLSFATRYSSGLIHAVMRSDRLDLLRIHDQLVLASEDRSLRFTVSVDAVGVGTGISARDRALTLRVLGNPDATAADLRRPGHVLPVRCPEFPFERRDQVWDMMIRAVSQSGLSPVAGACRLVRDTGDVLDETGAREFAAHFGLAVMPGR
ncbi:3,4-dihydroxy-2-butanone-4-phosphate synthase [Mycobacterium sp. SMC-4]|uniref:3,4-dihydroxy-2-butanone-4-phosphate synthase n=1 Tax=Mycobacterium sp. SMC-4 TaxID=2857059 RepID=UPI003D051772